ncbi:MAG: hypothetical protein FJ209_06275 [Betaproteobacteria bacterium]|nr:hypothetical protein [Betaproteobacteria bacterium]
MARGGRDQRALRRDLLLARAAAERIILADRVDALRGLARQGLPGILLGASSRGERPQLLKVAAGLWRLFRQRPWLASTLAGGAVRLLRTRWTRRATLAGLAAAGLWWWLRQNDTPATSGDDSFPAR